MKWSMHTYFGIWDYGVPSNGMVRHHHAATILNEKLIYIFGGLTKSVDKDEDPTNSMIVYDISTGQYHDPLAYKSEDDIKYGSSSSSSSGDSRSNDNSNNGKCDPIDEGNARGEPFLPPPLSHHQMVVVSEGRHLLVIGGKDDRGRFNKQLYRFDLVSSKWSECLCKGGLPARYGHSATCVDENRVFVFGGTNGENYFDDLYILDTATMTWLNAKTKGRPPIARAGHSAVLYGNQLIIFGGGNDEKMFNDVHALDIGTLEWSYVVEKGTVIPAQRTYHTANVVANKMIVFGGVGRSYTNEVMTFDLETHVWERPDMKEESCNVPALFGHTSVLSHNQLWVFGGKCENELYSTDSLFSLDTEIKGIEPIDVGHSMLSRDMLQMLDSSHGSFTDIAFKFSRQSGRPAIVAAHKIILCARCPVLYSKCYAYVTNNISSTVRQKLHQEDEQLFAMNSNRNTWCIDMHEFISSISTPNTHHEGQGTRRESNNDTAGDPLCITEEGFRVFLEFIYSDKLHLPKNGDQSHCSLLIQQVGKMATLFGVQRLYELCQASVFAPSSRSSSPLPRASSLNVPRRASGGFQRQSTDPVPRTRDARRLDEGDPDEEDDDFSLSDDSYDNNDTDYFMEDALEDEFDTAVNITPPQLAADMRMLFASRRTMPAVEGGDEQCDSAEEEDEDEEDEYTTIKQRHHHQRSKSASSPASLAYQHYQHQQQQFVVEAINSLADILFLIDDTIIPAHKCILDARCPFFNGMLKSGMVEATCCLSASCPLIPNPTPSSQITPIEITSVSAEVMEMILEYIYCDTIEDIPSSLALDLLVASKMYDLDRLTLMCQAVVEKKIHVHNACRILRIADSYLSADSHLREACIHYIVYHYNAVRKTQGWQELERDLHAEIKRRRAQARQEDPMGFVHARQQQQQKHKKKSSSSKGGKSSSANKSLGKHHKNDDSSSISSGTSRRSGSGSGSGSVISKSSSGQKSSGSRKHNDSSNDNDSSVFDDLESFDGSGSALLDDIYEDPFKKQKQQFQQRNKQRKQQHHQASSSKKKH